MGDIIQPVRKELDRVVKRQRQAAAKTSGALDAMMQELQAARAVVEADGAHACDSNCELRLFFRAKASPLDKLSTASGLIKDEARVISDELKELYAVLGKFGKVIDKVCTLQRRLFLPCF